MGHSRLLSKLANLLRKTCIKIGWADTRLGPPSAPGEGMCQTGGGRVDGCHFGSLVSIVGADGGQQHVAVMGRVQGKAKGMDGR